MPSSSRREQHTEGGPFPVEGPDPGVNHDEVIESSDGDEDADMGAVQEDEFEEEMGMVHEDIDDEISTTFLAQMGKSSKSYRRELENRVEELGLGGNVQIVGHCDDMPAAYMRSDVVVSASTDPEAFGRIVAESQAMGRPVVVADHGGAAEQVIDGVTGWRFEPGNPDKFADVLETALALDINSRAKLAEQASEHARSKYAKTGMCASTLRIYVSVYGSSKN